MKPVEPRGDGREHVVFAKDQPEYLPLPATLGPEPEDEVTTEWELDDEERRILVVGGRIQLKIWTFGRPLQPIQLAVVDSPHLMVEEA